MQPHTVFAVALFFSIVAVLIAHFYNEERNRQNALQITCIQYGGEWGENDKCIFWYEP